MVADSDFWAKWSAARMRLVMRVKAFGMQSCSLTCRTIFS
jgi:hypothetical protein